MHISSIGRFTRRTRYGPVERIGEITRPEGVLPLFRYNDTRLQLVVAPTNDGIEFTLENLTDHAIKVVWDEVAFVDFDRTSHRVGHSGVHYIDLNRSQPPSILAPRKLLEDTMVPVNRIEQTAHGFIHVPIMPTARRDCSEPEEFFIRRADDLRGADFAVFLPIEVSGVVHEYTLNFIAENLRFVFANECPQRPFFGRDDRIERTPW
jgi:hypothetical protein